MVLFISLASPISLSLLTLIHFCSPAKYASGKIGRHNAKKIVFASCLCLLVLVIWMFHPLYIKLRILYVQPSVSLSLKCFFRSCVPFHAIQSTLLLTSRQAHKSKINKISSVFDANVLFDYRCCYCCWCCSIFFKCVLMTIRFHFRGRQKVGLLVNLA